MFPPELLVTDLAPRSFVLVKVAELYVPLAVGLVARPLLANGAEPDVVDEGHVVVHHAGQLDVVVTCNSVGNVLRLILSLGEGLGTLFLFPGFPVFSASGNTYFSLGKED